MVVRGGVTSTHDGKIVQERGTKVFTSFMLYWLLFPTLMSSTRVEELVQHCSPQKFTFQQT